MEAKERKKKKKKKKIEECFSNIGKDTYMKLKVFGWGGGLFSYSLANFSSPPLFSLSTPPKL